MASNKSSMKKPPCIEVHSLPIPRQRMEATLTIDKRCYPNRKDGTVEKRIRISVFRKDCRSVEIFKQGIALAEEIKTGIYQNK